MPSEVDTCSGEATWTASPADVAWVEDASSIPVQERRIKVRVTTRAVMRTGLEIKAFITFVIIFQPNPTVHQG